MIPYLILGATLVAGAYLMGVALYDALRRSKPPEDKRTLQEVIDGAQIEDRAQALYFAANRDNAPRESLVERDAREAANR